MQIRILGKNSLLKCMIWKWSFQPQGATSPEIHTLLPYGLRPCFLCGPTVNGTKKIWVFLNLHPQWSNSQSYSLRQMESKCFLSLQMAHPSDFSDLQPASLLCDPHIQSMTVGWIEFISLMFSKPIYFSTLHTVSLLDIELSSPNLLKPTLTLLKSPFFCTQYDVMGQVEGAVARLWTRPVAVGKGYPPGVVAFSRMNE